MLTRLYLCVMVGLKTSKKERKWWKKWTSLVSSASGSTAITILLRYLPFSFSQSVDHLFYSNLCQSKTSENAKSAPECGLNGAKFGKLELELDFCTFTKSHAFFCFRLGLQKHWENSVRWKNLVNLLCSPTRNASKLLKTREKSWIHSVFCSVLLLSLKTTPKLAFSCSIEDLTNSNSPSECEPFWTLLAAVSIQRLNDSRLLKTIRR